jgi:integrase
MASVRKLDTGKYQARWREFPGGPQQARNFPLKKDADAFLDTIRGQLVRGEYVDPAAGRITFGGYVEKYKRLQVWRPRTRTANEVALGRALKIWSDRPISSIRTSDARSFIALLGETLAVSTIRVNVSSVSSVFGQAVADGVIARNPFVGVKRPKSDVSPLRPLTAEQVRSLLEVAEADFRLAVVLGAGLGLRQSEARGLTLDRVEFLRRQVRIDRQAAHGSSEWVPPKSANSDRVIPADAVVLDAVNAHVAEFGVGEEGLLLRGAVTGRMHSHGQWNTKWRRARTRAGLPDARYHDLRHHFASELLGHGVSLPAVAAAMGDEPTTVLRVYGHLTEADDDRIRTVIGGLWVDPLRPSEESSGS